MITPRRSPSTFFKRNFLFLSFLLGLAVVFAVFLSQFGLGESGYNFLGKTKKVTLSPGEPISEIFTAHENNLTQIRFVLGNADIYPSEKFTFQLLDHRCQDSLYSTTLRHRPLKQGAYTVFPFPALADSANQRYCFQITFYSDNSRQGDKPYVSATQEPNPIFADRTLIDARKNKTYPGQTLFLRPAYSQGGLVNDLKMLEHRLSQYKPMWMKGKILSLGLISLLLSLVIAYYLSRLDQEKAE